MRAGSGFGMVLHREDRQRLVSQAGDGVVIEIHVRDLDLGGQARFRNRKPVVMRRYLDLAGRQVLDRLVPAAVAELELVCVAAERLPDKLVPEADAEHRRLGFGKLADLVNDAGHRSRIARAVGKKYAVGLQGHHVFRRGISRHDRHAASASAKTREGN